MVEVELGYLGALDMNIFVFKEYKSGAGSSITSEWSEREAVVCRRLFMLLECTP